MIAVENIIVLLPTSVGFFSSLCNVIKVAQTQKLVILFSEL